MDGNSEVELLELKKVQYVYSMKCEGKNVSNETGSFSRGQIIFGLVIKAKVCGFNSENNKMSMVVFKQENKIILEFLKDHAGE